MGDGFLDLKKKKTVTHSLERVIIYCLCKFQALAFPLVVNINSGCVR